MILNFHTHSTTQPENGRSILNLIVGNTTPLIIQAGGWYSAGIHPWYIREDWQSQLTQLENLLLNPAVKLIGECGLDRLQGPDLEIQIQVFEAQIKMAEKIRKPLIIHCVKAFGEILEIKKRLKASVPMVIHGFNNKEETGLQLLKAGFYFSIGTAILKEKSNAARFLQSIPDNRLFLENDDRGIAIERVYEAAAEIRKTSVEQLKDLIFANWMSLQEEAS